MEGPSASHDVASYLRAKVEILRLTLGESEIVLMLSDSLVMRSVGALLLSIVLSISIGRCDSEDVGGVGQSGQSSIVSLSTITDPRVTSDAYIGP